MPVTLPPVSHHEVLPFAACTADDWLPAVKTLPASAFRNFSQLLQGMKLIHTDSGNALSLSPPHERVLARALGLPLGDGLIPWAALQQMQAGGQTGGQAWEYLTPCHWAMGREHATLSDPAALDLQADDSRTLLQAMQPYFASGGITLHYAEPTRWLAEGEVFRTLPSASLDRVLGRNVDPWLPGTKEMRLLQNEMQMLLYTHPLNDQRSGKGQLSVNSFWISGSGALPDNFTPPPSPDVALPRNLALPAFTSDWQAYTQAWAALDASEGARLLALQQRGDTLRLSLCGERNALTFETAQTSFFTKLSNIFSPRPFSALLEQL